MDKSVRSIMHSHPGRVAVLVWMPQESTQMGRQTFQLHKTGMQMQEFFLHRGRGCVETSMQLQARSDGPQPCSWQTRMHSARLPMQWLSFTLGLQLRHRVGGTHAECGTDQVCECEWDRNGCEHVRPDDRDRPRRGGHCTRN